LYDGIAVGKVGSHTSALYVHYGEVMDTGRTLIAFRVPTPASKRQLARIADQQGETLSDFIRTAIAQRVKRLNDEWVPTGNPAIDRAKIQ